MKKKFTALFLSSLFIFSFLFLSVMAQVQENPPAVNPNLAQLMRNITNKLWILFTGAAIIAFLVAGLTFLFAGGNPDKVKQARDIAIWGVVGIIIGMISYVIINLVSGLL